MSSSEGAMDGLAAIWSTLVSYLGDSGFGHFHWTNGVMLAIGAACFITPRLPRAR